LQDIRTQHPNANVTVMACDLSSLASVRDFAATYKGSGKPCHILIANAGVMACPFMLSAEKHEMQFATNHLGHHLLTKELLPVLTSSAQQAGSNSRVVVLSSAAHFNPYKKQAGGPIRFDALDSPEGYDVWGAYVSADVLG
jgi:WW domain-containing oxidoreductase